MKIVWDKVTGFSQIVAIILFVAVFYVGLMLGRGAQTRLILGKPINKVIFSCAEGKEIYAEFFYRMVHIDPSDAKSMYLPQTISASGARYADLEETIVFWNKGDTAFVQEGEATTYSDCVIKNK
jgi:membrane-bound inhibitor of C-type lysozyme